MARGRASKRAPAAPDLGSKAAALGAAVETAPAAMSEKEREKELRRQCRTAFEHHVKGNQRRAAFELERLAREHPGHPLPRLAHVRISHRLAIHLSAGAAARQLFKEAREHASSARSQCPTSIALIILHAAVILDDPWCGDEADAALAQASAEAERVGEEAFAAARKHLRALAAFDEDLENLPRFPRATDAGASIWLAVENGGGASQTAQKEAETAAFSRDAAMYLKSATALRTQWRERAATSVKLGEAQGEPRGFHEVYRNNCKTMMLSMRQDRQQAITHKQQRENEATLKARSAERAEVMDALRAQNLERLRRERDAQTPEAMDVDGGDGAASPPAGRHSPGTRRDSPGREAAEAGAGGATPPPRKVRRRSGIRASRPRSSRASGASAWSPLPRE